MIAALLLSAASPAPVHFCTLAAAPETYEGREISLTATFHADGPHGSILVDNDCPAETLDFDLRPDARIEAAPGGRGDEAAVIERLRFLPAAVGSTTGFTARFTGRFTGGEGQRGLPPRTIGTLSVERIDDLRAHDEPGEEPPQCDAACEAYARSIGENRGP